MEFLLTRSLRAAALVSLLGCSHGGADDPKPKGDGGSDLAVPVDSDLAAPVDLRGVDLRGRDLAPITDLTSSSDLDSRLPCRRGVGWTAFRFHYLGSTTAIVDTIGLPDRSNFQAAPGTTTTFDDAAHGGGISIASGNFILIRFSVDGLTRIKSATLTILGRSYNTTTSGSFRASSPLWGDIKTPTNAVSNAWPYDWTSVDYTANVHPGDPRGSTVIRIYAGPSSNSLIINTVELCIDGS